MALDWTLVKVEHVNQACDLFDQRKEAPVRPAKSTYLILNEKQYPAKFIRGLALKLATGRRLASDEYAGGEETVAFFHRLGLKTLHTPSPPSSIVVAAPTKHSPSQPESQKQALCRLLRQRFGKVICEAKFGWLVVPPQQETQGLRAELQKSLAAMRGYEGFATSGIQLCCDYWIKDRKLIIEYDERQHFTLARAYSLRCYPQDLKLHFDKNTWIKACEKIHANDPTPPYRDEQRAFYDSLRDIGAAENGFTLIRLKDGDLDWHGSGAGAALDEILKANGVTMDDPQTQPITEADREIVKSYLGKNENRWLWEDMVRDLLDCHDRRKLKAIGGKLRHSKTWKSKYRLSQFSDADVDDLTQFIRAEAAKIQTSASSESPPLPEAAYTPEVLDLMHSQSGIEKIALVSHNYKESDDSDFRDYSTDARRVIEVCDEQGCDTILFALYTWDLRSTVQRTADALFHDLKHVRRIVMEVGDISGSPSLEDLAVETWLKGSPSPVIHRQRFATSQQLQGSAHRLLDELEGRRMGKALLMICGETGIASVVRKGDTISDPHSFNDQLKQMGVQAILNPIHDYMSRPEMKKKRRYYSHDGRTVLSVWNKGKRKGESHLPWTVFHNGTERTESVVEVRSPVSDRTDIRIGIVSLAELRA